jgi:hypothetical protein
MATANYKARVREGLLLELPGAARELNLRPGDEVDIRIDRSQSRVKQNRPNEKALAALAEIARQQQGLPYTDGSDTQRLLREARAGAMYDVESAE